MEHGILRNVYALHSAPIHLQEFVLFSKQCLQTLKILKYIYIGFTMEAIINSSFRNFPLHIQFEVTVQLFKLPTMK